MTAVDTLVPGMNATHVVLAERLATASASRPDLDPTHPRDQYPATDTFLASASRHNSAVLAALVPLARKRLPDGEERMHEFVHKSRQFEMALSQVKAKLYGSTYSIRRPWAEVWDDVQLEFETMRKLEAELVRDLAANREPDDPDLGEELYHAELKAPTRPHPYVPHQGIRGKVARRVARRIDRFWDATEGRMVPEPIRHHDRSHDGKFTQYLLADPHLTED